MSILSALGIAVPSDDGIYVKQGEWLALVNEDFGFTKQDVEIPFTGVPNEYLDTVKTAYGHGVIVNGDKLDVTKYATNEFVSATILRASTADVKIDIPENGKKAKLADALEALSAAVKASNNKPVSPVPQSDIVPQADVADLSDVDYSVVGGKLVYAAADFDLAAGDKFIAAANEYNISGAAYEVKSVEYADGAAIVDVADVAIEDAVEAIDFEGSVEADLDKAVVYDNEGNLIENNAEPTVAGQGKVKDFLGDKASELIGKGVEAAENFLKNPKVSFSVKGIKVKAAYSGGRVDISVGGNVVDGVYAQKLYSLSNIKFDAKYDANIKKLAIKQAYLKMNYDLVETTVLEGSYAASVVPEGGSFTNEGASFLEKVKNNLGNLTLQKGGGIKVNIFTFDIPIANTGLTVEMNVSLTLSACGRIEIIVTSNETKGFEIINNKGRVIHESTIYDRAYNISGDFRAVLGLDLSLTFLKFKIVDVEFNGGIGAYVLTKIFNVKTHNTVTSELPLDVAVEASSGLDDLEDLRFCADVQLYGILSVSVGENSIISKIGLSKTWNFYDRGNGTFATLHIENSGIVDHCTYAAA
jgi:hypothetical protein